jgi:hypothetical protein
VSKTEIPRRLRRKIAEQANHRCGYCLTPERIVGMEMEVDHIIPEALGGRQKRPISGLPARNAISIRVGSKIPNSDNLDNLDSLCRSFPSFPSFPCLAGIYIGELDGPPGRRRYRQGFRLFASGGGERAGRAGAEAGGIWWGLFFLTPLLPCVLCRTIWMTEQQSGRSGRKGVIDEQAAMAGTHGIRKTAAPARPR